MINVSFIIIVFAASLSTKSCQSKMAIEVYDFQDKRILRGSEELIDSVDWKKMVLFFKQKTLEDINKNNLNKGRIVIKIDEHFISETFIWSMYSSDVIKTKSFVLCDGKGHLLASDFEIEILDEDAKEIFFQYLIRKSVVKK